MAKSTTPINKKTASRIVALRQRERMTIKALAEKSDVSVQTLYLLEGGKKGLTKGTASKLAVAFGVSADYLQGQSDFKTDAEAKTTLQIILDTMNNYFDEIQKRLNDLERKHN